MNVTIFILLLLISTSSSSSCSYSLTCSNDQCGISNNGYLSWDLSALYLNHTDYSIVANGYLYYANICGPINHNCTYMDGQAAAISVNTYDNTQCYVLGKYEQPDFQLLTMDASKGLNFTYVDGNPSNCPPNTDRTVSFAIQCDPSIDNAIFTSSEIMTDTVCSYQLTFTSKYGCPNIVRFPVAEKLSGGWIFIILFLVFTFIYSLLGLYPYLSSYIVNGKSSGDFYYLHPHTEFWSEFYIYFIEGITFCQTLILGRRPEYESFPIAQEKLEPPAYEENIQSVILPPGPLYPTLRE